MTQPWILESSSQESLLGSRVFGQEWSQKKSYLPFKKLFFQRSWFVGYPNAHRLSLEKQVVNWVFIYVTLNKVT